MDATEAVNSAVTAMAVKAVVLMLVFIVGAGLTAVARRRFGEPGNFAGVVGTAAALLVTVTVLVT